jgi:hypothetical protein
MASRNIEDHHNILRYLPKQKQQDGNPLSVGYQLRRENEEKELSANWIEYFVGLQKDQAISQIKRDLASTLRGNRLAAQAIFAELNVSRIRVEIVDAIPEAAGLDVVHIPVGGNPSHCGIVGVVNLPSDLQLAVASLLADMHERV